MTTIELHIIETKSGSLYISCNAYFDGDPTELEKEIALRLAPVVSSLCQVECQKHAKDTKSTP